MFAEEPAAGQSCHQLQLPSASSPRSCCPPTQCQQKGVLTHKTNVSLITGWLCALSATAAYLINWAMRPCFSPCNQSTIAPMQPWGTARGFNRRQLFAMYGTTDPLHGDRRESIHWLRKDLGADPEVPEPMYRFSCIYSPDGHECSLYWIFFRPPQSENTILTQHWETSVQHWHLSHDFLALPLPLFRLEDDNYFYDVYLLCFRYLNCRRQL